MRYRWELALVAMCAIWGWTFVVVRDAVARTPPFLFLAIRFSLAVATLGALGLLRGLRRDEVRAGALIGVALFGGYAFQTVGLQYTTATNAGLITGLWVVFTPILAAALLRRVPSRAVLLGVVLCTAGLFLLASPEGLGIRRGDLIVLGGALSFSFHVLAIARLAAGRSAIRVSAVQFATTAILSVLWTMGAERAPFPTNGTVWFALVITAVLASALALTVQVRAQQDIPPTRTAVILTAEPVFAAIFGAVLAGDRFGARGYAGAVLIIVGILAAELLAPKEEMV